MPSLTWSPSAAADVQRLYRFLRSKNQDAAQRAVKAMREGVNVLKQQPRIGRVVGGMPEQYREWLIDFGSSGYVVRYHIDQDTNVIILAVRHQKEAGF